MAWERLTTVNSWFSRKGRLCELQLHRLLQDEAALGALPFEVCDGSSSISNGVESFLDSLQRGLYSHVRELLRMDVVKVRLEGWTCHRKHWQHLFDMNMIKERCAVDILGFNRSLLLESGLGVPDTLDFMESFR